MRNWSNVLYTPHCQTKGPKRTNRRFSADPGSVYKNVNFLQALIHRLSSSGFCCGLCRIRGRLFRPAKPKGSCARPRNRIAVKIGDRYDSIVESCLNKHLSFINRFLLFSLSCFCQSLTPRYAWTAFFFPATVFFFPFLVRAFVFVL